jgi:phosphomannomutase
MPTLMVSISGIRGIVGDGLDPETLIKFTAAYAKWIGSGTVVIGRDSRITGAMVSSLTAGALNALGIDVVDIGIVPTPTVQFAVKTLGAQGGIAISASHNPNEWNALKLLNSTGQFMSPDQHNEMKKYLGEPAEYKRWDKIGQTTFNSEMLELHKEKAMNMEFIDIDLIRSKKFKVVADCVNGAGVWVIPDFLRDFGCEVIEMNCEKTGIFPRLPEPIPENLVDTMKKVKETGADFAVVVDPDADRLVLITDEGEPFSEENTISHVVKWVLSKTPGNVVVNLSTTRTVDDVAEAVGCKVFRSPVGEANVVQVMKETNAVIGGEGSGGVIYPALHYGRDSLVGVAITLQHLAEFGGKLSEMKRALPQYFIAKKKIDISGKSPDEVLQAMVTKYSSEKINTDDGLRIDFPDHWVHFRKSNTEPIIRVIAETTTYDEAVNLCEKYFKEITSLL